MSRYTDKSREGMLEDRMARVASYKIQGLSVRQTAAALARDKCLNPETKKPWSHQAVQRDVTALVARWKSESLRDITEVKAGELAKLDRLERVAWEAWERSVGKHQVRTTKTGRVDKEGSIIAEPEVTLRTEPLAGDPRFLATVLECQERRSKLLGLDMPAKVAQTTADGEDLYDQDARAALHAKLLG